VIKMRPNESLDSTGFCNWVLPLGFSVLMISPPVSQLGRSLRREVASTTAERGVVSDSALPFAAGILWEQAFDGRREPLPRVWSLPNNVVNLGASIRGDARIGRYGQNI
jgi:hypothetical protein